MKIIHTLLAAALSLGLAAAAPGALAQEKKNLTIGATAGPNFDQLKLGIKPIL